MASKRKQDEKHLKMLREMVALPHNKQCFDCHQRGPTYVNMTIGSYVCTACSGILRGINPPHRVKSISMASFTPEEIEFIKCHGNDFCRKVWLGLFDSRTSSEPDSRDEQKVKDFMVQKYERKRWYVAPTDAMKDEAKQMNEAATNKQPATKPLKSLLGENAPRLVVQNNQSPHQTPKNPPPVQAPAQNAAASQKSFPSPGTVSQSSQSSGSVTMDLLGDLGGDPFASSTAAPAAAPQSQATMATGGGGGFADFANFNQFSATPASSQSFPAFQSTSNPLVPLGGTSSTPAANDGGFGGLTSTAPPTQSLSSTSAPAGGDKYSALSDLFSDGPSSQTQAPAPSAGINWSGGGGGGSGSINWGGDSAGGSGISWGGSTTSSTAGAGSTGVNWNSSGSTGTGNTGINWNSTASTSASAGGSGWNSSTTSNAGFPATVFPPPTNMYPTGKPGNPFFSDSGGSVSNPFGGGGGAPMSTQSTMGGGGGGVSNPFGGGGAGQQNLFAGTGGFGQPQPSSTGGFGFGQGFGGAPQPAGAGFGGAPQPASAGFGGAPQPASSGFGGAPQPTSAGFGGAQQQTSAGFGGAPQPAGAGFGGAPQPTGFGGAPTGVPQAPFGQFGMQNGGTGFNQMAPVSSAGGFPQTMSNFSGAMNASSGQFNKMGGGQSAQGFPAGWGQTPQQQQQPAANPFMNQDFMWSSWQSSAASQPMATKSGSTNPFL